MYINPMLMLALVRPRVNTAPYLLQAPLASTHNTQHEAPPPPPPGSICTEGKQVSVWQMRMHHGSRT